MTSETKFLDEYSAEDYEHPSVAVDVALVTVVDGSLCVLVVMRGEHPHAGTWQLPGGFVQMDEPVEVAARRVLETKAGISGLFVEQLFTFGKPDRDPRTRVISIAHYALVEPTRLESASADSTLARIDVPWSGETGGPIVLLDGNESLRVAFDHADMIGMVVKRLRGKLNYAPVGYELLPDEFTLLDLQLIHEAILGVELNKDSFRRRMLATGDIEPTGRRQTDVGHRPAALYRCTAR